jgi:hypothetical protein
MSQAGIVDVEGSHPQIPTAFVTNSGTAVPIANTLEILGTTVAAHSIPLQTTGSGNTVTIQAQYASAAASSVANNAGFASFNSADFTVDANGFVTLTGNVALTFDGNTGSATPSGGVITIENNTSYGTGLITASGSTLTLTLANVSSQNLGIGASTGFSHATTASYNNAYGFEALTSVVTSLNNDAFGQFSLTSLTGGATNSGFGTGTLENLLTGSNNIAIGVAPGVGIGSGASYTGSESNNIVIGNAGVVGESNVIRLGSQGTGAGEQNLCYIAGITGATPVSAHIPQVVVCDNTGNLTPLSSSTAGFVLTSNGTATPSFQAVSASGSITTITGNSGGAEVPSSGNFNILGTGSITIAGSANTETVQLTGLTNHALQVGAGTATLTQLATTATAGQVLQSSGSSLDPAYSTATYPSTTTLNEILYSSSANVVGQITAANNGVLITGTTGIPSLLADGTTGQVLTATTGSPPSWVSPATSGTVTSVSVVSANGFAGTVATATTTPAITISTTQTGLLSGNGTAITGTAITQFNVITAGASNAPNSVAPSATSGVPLISQGSSSQPVFGTAVVAGGGTGDTSFTAYSVICGGTTTTGALQNVSGLGTSGQVLTSNGASALPTWQTASTNFTSINTQIFTSSGTYTPTSGMLYCTIEVVGGGGGGGGSAAGSAAAGSVGGGGGGGGYSRITVLASTIGASQTVTIAAAAAGGVGANPGATGGTCSLGSIISATGGVGGATGTAAITTAAIGGGGGLGASGTINSTGGAGGFGTFTLISGVAQASVSGVGGNSYFGGGAASVFTAGGAQQFNGNAGQVYGGGGSGAVTTTSGSAANGGAGAKGVVVVTEYI